MHMEPEHNGPPPQPQPPFTNHVNKSRTGHAVHDQPVQSFVSQDDMDEDRSKAVRQVNYADRNLNQGNQRGS